MMLLIRTENSKAGARIFPELVPTPPNDPTGRPNIKEAENNSAAWSVFQKVYQTSFIGI